MKVWKKLLFTAVVLTVLACALMTAAFATEAVAEPSLRIQSFNLALENATYMNFKVSAENVTDPTSIKLLAWESAPEKYEKGTEDLCLNVSYIEESTGYAVFRYDDLDAKEMTKMVYVCAYVEQNGEETYSANAKFSVAMYAYLKRNAANPNVALVALMDQMLAYGAKAQEYFGYNTDYLANATLYQIDVVNGKLEDGFAKGWYQSGAPFTLIANEPAAGYIFSHWENKVGESVGLSPIMILSATQVDTYTAFFVPQYSEGLDYSENADGTYSVSGIGTCNDTFLRIPTFHNGKTVTGITDFAFKNCKRFTRISIPESIVRIGTGAFEGCSTLTAVHITDLEAWCRIEFPETYASSNPLFLAHNLYLNGRLVTDLVIPDGITTISNYAFIGCTNLKSVHIPEGVTSVGKYAFSKCTGLTSVEIPSTLTSYGMGAFGDCEALTGVYISDLAAWCQTSFASEVGTNPLYYAGNLYVNGALLTNLVIPDSVEVLGYRAFLFCSSIQTVYIPASVKSIAYDDYYVDSLVSATFSYCKNLMMVTFAEDSPLTELGGGMFAGCENLTTVTLPSGLTSIDSQTFQGCSKLASVTIPSSVTSIGNYAFEGTAITSIAIPEGVTSIGSGAFTGCNKLAKVYITDLAKWCAIAFEGNPLSCVADLYLDETLVTELIIPEGVTSIGNNAFSGCSSIESLIIPEGVISIGEYAFYNCKSLISVKISEGVTSIGKNAFEKCTSLTSIVIPDSVTSIKDYAFYECTSLVSVTLGKNVSGIGQRAFYGCTSLKNVDLAEGLKRIGTEAFARCTALTSIVIPDSVTSVESRAFENCNNLISVTIGNGVRSINLYTFQGCSKLKSITIASSVTNINDAFDYCNSLANVYYVGTESDWAKVTGTYNITINGHCPLATIYYYTETEPAATGNYWHYVDGVPTKW